MSRVCEGVESLRITAQVGFASYATPLEAFVGHGKSKLVEKLMSVGQQERDMATVGIMAAWMTIQDREKSNTRNCSIRAVLSWSN
jgi:hypothetical protein